MLSDAAGEHDEVNSVHHGCELADVLDDAVSQHLEGKLAPHVACIGAGIQVTGIGGHSGNAEEAALLVHYLGHLIRSEIVLLHQIRDDVRVNAAASGTHDHSVKRGESHRSVDGLAVQDSGDGTSVAEMAGDDSGIVHVQAGELCALLGHELMTGSMRTVLADPVLGIILVRKAVHECVWRY